MMFTHSAERYFSDLLHLSKRAVGYVEDISNKVDRILLNQEEILFKSFDEITVLSDDQTHMMPRMALDGWKLVARTKGGNNPTFVMGRNKTCTSK